jgi:hypothetical protein
VHKVAVFHTCTYESIYCSASVCTKYILVHALAGRTHAFGLNSAQLEAKDFSFTNTDKKFLYSTKELYNGIRGGCRDKMACKRDKTVRSGASSVRRKWLLWGAVTASVFHSDGFYTFFFPLSLCVRFPGIHSHCVFSFSLSQRTRRLSLFTILSASHCILSL